MPQHRSAKPRRHCFTMIELMTVITLTAILLSVTMRVLKTDPSKANAAVIGGALNVAQAKAMSTLTSPLSFIRVEIKADGKITIYAHEITTSTVITEVGHYSMKSGSSPSPDGINTGSTIDFYFNYRGEPIVSTNSPDVEALEFTATNLDIWPIDPEKPTMTTAQIEAAPAVYIRPFTGKIAFYP